jgi:hypothetical protein
MKAKAIRALIEFLNKKYPYLCREIVIGDKYHIHKNPQKKRVGLAPVEIVTDDGNLIQIITSDGLDPKDAYDFGKELPGGMNK